MYSESRGGGDNCPVSSFNDVVFDSEFITEVEKWSDLYRHTGNASWPSILDEGRGLQQCAHATHQAAAGISVELTSPRSHAVPPLKDLREAFSQVEVFPLL